MSEHLTFDEMVDFLKTYEVNDETLRMAYRVNEHISNCNECYIAYNTLFEQYEDSII